MLDHDFVIPEISDEKKNNNKKQTSIISDPLCDNIYSQIDWLENHLRWTSGHVCQQFS